FDQVFAHVAGALHGHLSATERIGAVGFFRGGLHAHIHTIGGNRAGIAAAAHFDRQAGHVLRFLADVHHLGGAHAHILGGDVPAIETVHELPEAAEHRLGLLRARIADDHGLSPAQIEPGERALVRHAAAEAQHILQRFGLAGVGPHARAAERGPEGGIVYGDDGPEAGGPIETEEHFLVIVLLHAADDEI